MVASPSSFLKSISQLPLSNAERAVALLWWFGLTDHTCALSPRELAKEIEKARYARQNVSRLAKKLSGDPRTTKTSNGAFAIKINSRNDLNEQYLAYVKQRPIEATDSVLPSDLFKDTRGYVEKVVAQVNASYDHGLYDCCAVMCRRLLETLIIEIYEKKGWADELKNSDGHFKMFSGPLDHIANESRFNIGRSSLKALQNLKKLGDLSAHNRRFNARKDDIDRVRDGIRVAAEELLHLAGLI